MILQQEAERPISVHASRERNSLAQPGLVSVLVPCCGQLEYTRLCVPSLLRHSRLPYELIFLDIGSLDGTAEYLCGVAAAASVNIEVVRAITDHDIPGAVEQALALAQGEFLVLLNNDIIVTADWLTYLTGLANLAPAVGLVGPMSNAAAPPQRVDSVPYRLTRRDSVGPGSVDLSSRPLLDVEPVNRFAREWCEQYRGKWLEVDHLGGFCLLVKRQVLDAVGLLETKSGLGIFDTDSLCQKARQAGYTLAVCKDVFVHHFASRPYAQGRSGAPN
jgi:GT2 family glycosyltransferase